jgi:heat shock protein HtpX
MLDTRTRRRQHIRNAAQGVLLLAAMLAVLGVLASLLLGISSLIWVLVLGGILLATRPKIPPQWVLSMYGARPLPAPTTRCTRPPLLR